MPTSSDSQGQSQPLLLRIDEAALLLSLGRSTVYEMIYKGQLPFVMCGNARRIPLAALLTWIEKNTQHNA